ncbi:PepSY domain-containing protein [Microbacterium flavescens]|uniref:PepSY domain-containing protein n=1 Tax=Microbacterium flavescens TaxID=69366 RepID=UPI001BDF5D26|nr:PepSY domain-containing protein [Microbacterium flavescens]
MRKSAIIITSAAVVASLAGGAAAFAANTTPQAPLASTVAANPSETPSVAPTPGSGALGVASGNPTDLDAAIAAALEEVGPGTVVEADIDDDRDHAYEIDIRLDAGGFAEVYVDADLKVVAVNPDDADGSSDDASDDGSSDDDAVTDEATRQKAADAALAHVGTGTVTSVEFSDDADHVYEVEIDLGNGDDADVELDADFAVVKVD